ncbi:MAG: glyoxalase [Actinomycetota bacterium]
MSDRAFQLTTVIVGDPADAWARAGFVMDGPTTRIGSTTIVCEPTGGPGILGVSIDGLAAPVDGLPIGSEPTVAAPLRDTHPNRVTGFDHLVAMSPAVDRTSMALEAVGLEKRRTREFTVGDETRRQDFFWMGDVILELVGVVATVGVIGGDGAAPPSGRDLPATFWGLALECDDLDAAAEALGDGLGRIKDAVQTGRRIATIRSQELGVSVPIALMSPHVRG